MLTACEQAVNITCMIYIHDIYISWYIYIYHCCVFSKKTPENGQRNCPKHVEFYSKNNFEKLVHLVGFSIRIYDDARSPERQSRHSVALTAVFFSKQ